MKQEIKQPVGRGKLPGQPTIHCGSARAVNVLKHLGFDPIGELVNRYRILEKEIEYQEKLRDGVIVELSANGKPRNYRPEVHHALYDRIIKINEALLRYRYGRVPETNYLENSQPKPMIINLSKKGETYIINNEQPEMSEVNEDEY